MAARNGVKEPLACWGSSVLSRHVGLGSAFVQENQAVGIDLTNLSLPSPTLLFYLGTLLLTGMECLFLRV